MCFILCVRPRSDTKLRRLKSKWKLKLHMYYILCNQKINRQFTWWQKVNNKSKQRKKSILVYNGKEVLETNLSFVVRLSKHKNVHTWV